MTHSEGVFIVIASRLRSMTCLCLATWSAVGGHSIARPPTIRCPLTSAELRRDFNALSREIPVAVSERDVEHEPDHNEGGQADRADAALPPIARPSPKLCRPMPTAMRRDRRRAADQEAIPPGRAATSPGAIAPGQEVLLRGIVTMKCKRTDTLRRHTMLLTHIEFSVTVCSMSRATIAVRNGLAAWLDASVRTATFPRRSHKETV